MGARSSLLKNTLALSLPNAVSPFLSFILVLIISRYLGTEGLGQYSLLLSFSLIFTTIASLGLGTLVVREVSRDPKHVHEFFLNSLAFGFISALVALVLMNAVIHLLRYDSEIVLGAFFCSIGLIPATTIRYMESVFRGLERSEYVALGFAFENVLRVVICVPLVLMGWGIVTIFAVIAIIRLLQFFFLYYFYVKLSGCPKWTFQPDVWQLLTREAPTFAGIAIFSTLHLNMSEVLLSKLVNIEAVGIFSAAGRIITICETIPLGFAMAVLPFLTRKSEAGLKNLYESSMTCLRYIFLGICPVIVGIFIIGDDIIQLIYGQKFVSSGPVLRYLAFSMLPYTMALILAQLLIATNNQRLDLLINISAVVLSFVFNIVLIPRMAELGAVLGVFLTLVILNQLQYLAIKKCLFPMPILSILKKPALASLLMGACTYCMQGWNIFLNVAISACLYFLLVYLFKALSHDDLVGLRKLLPVVGRQEAQ
jgi:O-antigen/teichoic acid export membrane protein